MLDVLQRIGEGLARANRDRLAAEGCLPPSAREVAVEGTRGWIFRVTAPQGEPYRLFLWFDGAAYQVKVVDPDVSGCEPHACHLFPGGRLCLGREHGGGMPTLQDAYAKAVVWVAGHAAWRATGAFPY